MRPAAIFTGITGMAVVVGLLMAGEARLRGGTAGEETAPAGETAAAPDATTEPTERAATISDERAEMIARSVVPAGSPPPEPPDRAAPKLATITQQAAPVEKKAMELPRPLVENAGSLSFGERRLHLAGIIPTPADKICGSAGRHWPCGMMAKTALRQLLRNRSITCDLDAVEWKGTAIATCRLGTQDLGTWLAENGWAEAEAGSPLAPIAEKTRQAQKGIYGGDPRRK